MNREGRWGGVTEDYLPQCVSALNNHSVDVATGTKNRGISHPKGEQYTHLRANAESRFIRPPNISEALITVGDVASFVLTAT